MRTYYFSDPSVLSWSNNYGVSALFILSRAPVFQSILSGKAPSEFSPVCLPFILFATHRGIHKRLTYKTIFHFIQNQDESDFQIVSFPSWLSEFQNSFRPEIIKKLKEMAEKYNSLPNICYDK